jgi:DNA-binding NarL/FixJ family response regulator
VKRARVLLADDHTIVAEGLESLLEDEFELVGTVTDGRALVEAASKLKPDVILADISMPVLNGLDAVRQIKKQRPGARVIFLTMHSEPPLVAEAFKAGASGYLLKQSAGEELIRAIREVLKGRTYVTPLIASDLITVLMASDRKAAREGKEITARQREVLQLIAEGRTMKEIARVLKISARTVEAHKYEMMQTLGVRTTAELIQYAIRIGMVPV